MVFVPKHLGLLQRQSMMLLDVCHWKVKFYIYQPLKNCSVQPSLMVTSHHGCRGAQCFFFWGSILYRYFRIENCWMNLAITWLDIFQAQRFHVKAHETPNPPSIPKKVTKILPIFAERLVWFSGRRVACRSKTLRCLGRTQNGEGMWKIHVIGKPRFWRVFEARVLDLPIQV